MTRTAHVLIDVLLMMIDILFASCLVFCVYVFMWYVSALRDRHAYRTMYRESCEKQEELRVRILKITDDLLMSELHVKYYKSKAGEDTPALEGEK